MFSVMSKESSIYDDKTGQRYNFPRHIPNGRKIDVGSVLIVINSKKEARKNGKSGRILGLCQVGVVEEYSFKGREFANAFFDWWIEFEQPVSFEACGGDWRNNIQNAINSVPERKRVQVLLGLMKAYSNEQ